MFNIEQIKQLLSNPYGEGIRNYISEILNEEYPNHQAMVEKLTEQIKNEKDYKLFGSFILAIYSKGHKTAVEQHQKALEKMGLKTKII